MPKATKEADAAILMKEVVAAATGGKSIRKAAIKGGLSSRKAQDLEKAIHVDLDVWRSQMKQKLMKAGEKMLHQIDSRMEEIPASSWAFTFAAIRDSITHMDSKTAPQSAAINIQVNNYGSDKAAKEALISTLLGDIPATTTTSSDTSPVLKAHTAPLPPISSEAAEDSHTSPPAHLPPTSPVSP